MNAMEIVNTQICMRITSMMSATARCTNPGRVTTPPVSTCFFGQTSPISLAMPKPITAPSVFVSMSSTSNCR